MSFLQLAPELVLLITDYLSTPDIFSLLLTCRYLAATLSQTLFERSLTYVCPKTKNTALHHASKVGYLAHVRYILSSNHDLRFTSNKEGWYPLHIAAQHDQVAAASLLLDYGAADPNKCRNDVRRLLLSEIYLASFAAQEATPLHLARSAEMVRVLIAGFEDVKVPHPSGMRVWNSDTSSWYSELPLVNAEKANGERPLLTATKNGNVPVVRELLAHGASIHRHDGTIQIAVESGFVEVVKALIDAVKTFNGEGGMLLHTAVNIGSVEIVRMILNAHWDIDWNDWGRIGTALECACELGEAEIVEELLHWSPDTAAVKDRRRGVILNLAEHKDVAKVLSKHGVIEMKYEGSRIRII